MALRPYQRDSIDNARRVWDAGIRYAMVVQATGLGKALRNDQRVLTPWGWVRMDEIMPGDQVVGGDGRLTVVTGVFQQGVRPMVVVRTNDGAEVVCDESHLWTVQLKPHGSWHTLTTAMLMPGSGPIILPSLPPDDRWPAIASGERRIASFTPCAPAEATCIKVAAADGLFVTEGYVVTHNTVTFSHAITEVLSEHPPDAKALVLAHRNELLEQAKDKYLRVEPGAAVGIYQGAKRETWASVICASIQSLYPDKLDAAGNVVRRGRMRDIDLAKLKIVVIDECHHTPAPTYLALLDAIEKASPDCVFLGVTATPRRGDGRGLGVKWNTRWADFLKGRREGVEGVLVYKMGIQRGIDEGYLAPMSPASRRVIIDAINLDAVKVSKSTHDFVESSLAEQMDTAPVRAEIVRVWQEKAGPGAAGAPPGGRPTAIFCAGVEAAANLARDFNEAGIPAGTISGATDKTERKATIEAYQRGDLLVLTNCAVLTEGWDAPHTSCIVVARPTKSTVMFAQMAGRGTRLLGQTIDESIANGKADFLLIDFCGASEKGIVGQEDLSRSDFAPGIDATPEEEEAALLLEASPADIEQLVMDELGDSVSRTIIRGVTEVEIDLFDSRVSWARVNGTRICVVCAGLSVLCYRERSGEGYTSIAMSHGDRKYRTLASGTSEAEAMRRGAAYALLHGLPGFLMPGPWFTKRPASEAQVHRLTSVIQLARELDARHAALGYNVTPLSLAGLPRDVRDATVYQAMLWITYLHARIAFGTQVAAEVDDLVSADDRVAALQRFRGREARG